MVGNVTLFRAALISNTAKQLFINGKWNGKEGCKEHQSAAGTAGSSYEASVNLLSAPWGIRGCAAAAPRSMGGWGCPIHPPWPLWDGARLFLHITCSPQFRSFVSPSGNRSRGDLWHWESCACRRKISFGATRGLFLYPLPSLWQALLMADGSGAGCVCTHPEVVLS